MDRLYVLSFAVGILVMFIARLRDAFGSELPRFWTRQRGWDFVLLVAAGFLGLVFRSYQGPHPNFQVITHLFACGSLLVSGIPLGDILYAVYACVTENKYLGSGDTWSVGPDSRPNR